jgi:hypothetical protein
MSESAAPQNARRTWLPWALLILWLGWIAFLAWTSHPYWGVPRPVPTPDPSAERPGP